MNILSSKANETVTLGNPVSPESNSKSREIDLCNHENENHDMSSQELMAMQNSDHSFPSHMNDHEEERKELHLSKENGSHVTGSPPGSEAISREKTEEKVPLSSATMTMKRAPKKIVSIKETVEDIDSIMKERRKSKGSKRSKSFDFENGYDGSLRPSRSILKVGSTINDKSVSFNSSNGIG